MNFEKGSVQKARRLTEQWIEKKLAGFSSSISIGLPEYDDRHNKWRVPLNLENGKHLLIGEVSIDESLNEIIDFTDIQLIQKRIKKYRSIAAEKTAAEKAFSPRGRSQQSDIRQLHRCFRRVSSRYRPTGFHLATLL